MDKQYPNNLRKIRLSQKSKELQSGSKIAELLEVTPQYYYKLETGREGKRLNVEHLRKLSKIFNVTADEILGGYSLPETDMYSILGSVPEMLKALQHDTINALKIIKASYDFQELINALVAKYGLDENGAREMLNSIDNFENLSLEEQSRINNCVLSVASSIGHRDSQELEEQHLAFSLHKQTNKTINKDSLAYPPKIVKLPIIGTVTAGPNGLAYSEPIGEEWTDEDDINNGAKYYWLKVRGDSMIGEGIMPGDLALIREQSDIESGDLAIVVVDDEEGTLKRVYKKENSLVLQSANAAYPPRIFAGTELNLIRIVGKVKVTKRKY